MSFETATPKRLAFARKWERKARILFFAAIGLLLLGGLMKNFWIALFATITGMPLAWIFNLRCPACSWLVYKEYGTAKRHYEIPHLPSEYAKDRKSLPEKCTKCGFPFTSFDTSEGVSY